MQIQEADHRQAAITAAVAIVLILFGLLGFALLTRPKTQFEREQARAEASNPKWLKVEITTSDHRYKYREGEPILVIAHFSSAVSHMYKADAAQGAGRAAASDLLHISNGQERPLNMVGVVCCAPRLIGLDNEPYTPPSLSPLKLEAGSYEIYLTSRRVFKWEGTDDPYHPSPFEVASNMLRIQVLADSGRQH